MRALATCTFKQILLGLSNQGEKMG